MYMARDALFFTAAAPKDGKEQTCRWWPGRAWPCSRGSSLTDNAARFRQKISGFGGQDRRAAGRMLWSRLDGTYAAWYTDHSFI